MSKKITLKDMMNSPMNLTQYEEKTNKNRGRPKKGKKRDCSIPLYCTEEEKRRLQDEAEKLGLSLNAYIRFKIFHS